MAKQTPKKKKSVSERKDQVSGTLKDLSLYALYANERFDSINKRQSVLLFGAWRDATVKHTKDLTLWGVSD